MTLLVPLLPPANALAQDDAGLGRDAPDAWEDAAPLALDTRYTGTVGPWEYQNHVEQHDWYVVDVPAGEWLHVEVERLGSDIRWLNVEALDATGARLDFFSFPYVRTFGIDVPTAGATYVAVWIYGGNPALDYALTLSLVPAPDADLPGDAAERSADALPLAFGSYHGRLDPDAGDAYDWYRIDLPPDQGLFVWMEPWNGNARLESLNEHGTRGTRDNGWFWPRDMYLPRWGDTYWLAVASTGGGGSYTLRIEPLELPDLRVVSIEVSNESLVWDEEEIEESHTAREVRITIENVGLGPTQYQSQYGLYPESASLQAWSTSRHDTNFVGRHLGVFGYYLAPGESTTITVPWDTTGQVGGQDLHAWVQTRFDRSFADNYAQQHAAAAEGLPEDGYDALNFYKRVGENASLYGYYRSCWRGGQDSFEASVIVRLDEGKSEELALKDCDGWLTPESPLDPPPLPTARARMASANVEGITYLLGGEGEDGPLAEVLAFLPAAELATPRVPLPSPRAGAAAATDGVFIYLFGGEGSGGFLDEIVRYDPRSGSAEVLAAKLPTPRHGAVAIHDARAKDGCPMGCVYVFGGIDLHEDLHDPYETRALSVDDVLRFDPVSGELTTLATKMPAPVIVGPTTWDGERVLFFGLDEEWGSNVLSYADAWWYDPFTDEGDHRDQFFFQRIGGVAFWLDDIAYALGGPQPSEWDSARDGIAWDPDRRMIAWLDDSIQRPFRDGVAVPIEGGAYLIGGRDPATGTLSAHVERWQDPHEWWRD